MFFFISTIVLLLGSFISLIGYRKGNQFIQEVGVVVLLCSLVLGFGILYCAIPIKIKIDYTKESCIKADADACLTF